MPLQEPFTLDLIYVDKYADDRFDDFLFQKAYGSYHFGASERHCENIVDQ